MARDDPLWSERQGKQLRLSTQGFDALVKSAVGKAIEEGLFMWAFHLDESGAYYEKDQATEFFALHLGVQLAPVTGSNRSSNFGRRLDLPATIKVWPTTIQPNSRRAGLYDQPMSLREQALDLSAGVGHKLDAEDAPHLLALAAECAIAAPELLAGSIEDKADAGIVYRTLSAIAASGIRRDSAPVVDAAIKALVSIYQLGDYDVGMGLDTPAFEASIWESIWIEVAALGGLVVRRQAWDYLKPIAIQEPKPGDSYYVSWHRHGQVHSARSSTYPDEWVLDLAAKRLAEIELEAESDALSHVCQCDLLAALLIAELDDAHKFYPNAAAFSEQNVEPIVIDFLRDEDGPLRQIVFPKDTPKLREQLREYNELAISQAALYRYSNNQDWAWRGFQDARTWSYIREGNILEEWQTLPI